MDWVQYLTAFGVGALLTTVVQLLIKYYTEKKAMHFNEKKESFIGLLDAYHKAAVRHSDANSKAFAFWQMRCELVASIGVRKAIQDIVDTNDDLERRHVAHELLKTEMRSDLGFGK